VATSPARREAQNPGTDHAEQIFEEVRTRIAPEDWVLDESRNRREEVRTAAERFTGSLRSFPSGSLAHRTANNHVSDGDAAWCSTGACGTCSAPTAAATAARGHARAR
jgi:hypothetical protein